MKTLLSNSYWDEVASLITPSLVISSSAWIICYANGIRSANLAADSPHHNSQDRMSTLHSLLITLNHNHNNNLNPRSSGFPEWVLLRERDDVVWVFAFTVVAADTVYYSTVNISCNWSREAPEEFYHNVYPVESHISWFTSSNHYTNPDSTLKQRTLKSFSLSAMIGWLHQLDWSQHCSSTSATTIRTP